MNSHLEVIIEEMLSEARTCPLLGFSTCVNLSGYDKTFLCSELLNPDCDKISVGEYYDCFKINPKNSVIIPAIKNVSCSSLNHKNLPILTSLPIGTTASVEDYFSYSLPSAIVLITNKKLGQLESNLIDSYSELYTSCPNRRKSFIDYLNGLRSNILGSRDFNSNNISVNSKCDKNSAESFEYRERLEKEFSILRKKIIKTHPLVAEKILASYFRVESMTYDLLFADLKV